jgi:hypothetical protein
MALVGEPGVSGEPGEIALPAAEALERCAGAKAHSMSRDRVTRLGTEDATQVVR